MSIEADAAREAATRFLEALSHLWNVTDLPGWQDPSLYDEQDLKAILGQWIHIRKACDEAFRRIREARPDMPGWDPIQGDKPIDERLADASSESA